MSSLAEAAFAYTAVVAVFCVVLAVTGRPRPPLLDTGLVVVAIAAAVVALVGLSAIARGQRPADLATHIGYLLTAPMILPATASSMQGDRGRWSSAAFATGCVVLLVVLLRVVATSDA